MEMCSTSFRRLLGLMPVSLSIPLHPESCTIIFSLHRLKTAACFILDLKWCHTWTDSPSPSPPQRAATGTTHYTRTRETQLKLLPWQPSQRITVLQYTTPTHDFSCCWKIKLLVTLCCVAAVSLCTHHNGNFWLFAVMIWLLPVRVLPFHQDTQTKETLMN